MWSPCWHNTYQYYDINKISSLVYYKFNDYLQLHDKEGQYTYLYVENHRRVSGTALRDQPIGSFFGKSANREYLCLDRIVAVAVFVCPALQSEMEEKRSAGAASGATDYDRSLYGVAGQWKYTLCDAAFIYTAVFDPFGTSAGKGR